MTAQSKTIHIEASSDTSSVMAYHRDFPEIRAQGSTEEEAVRLLGHQLTRALDSALTDWRRQSLQAALDDAHAHTDAAQSS
jgi:predicted RNase H-like HicB family nuclease